MDRDADLVRVGKGVKGKVYFWDGEAWTLSSNKVELPEGAFVGFPSKMERKMEMSEFHPVALGSVGTATTFGIETINPWLGFICGVLTRHISLSTDRDQ